MNIYVMKNSYDGEYYDGTVMMEIDEHFGISTVVNKFPTFSSVIL